MQRFPDLRGVEELFWKLITAPEGVVRGAAELHREGSLESEDLSFLVPPNDRLGSAEQLDIYADMYFHRLHDCLAEDFPVLVARLGGARFHNLVTDYLLAHAPTHFSLRELGRALPGFLESHALDRELPTLADLARLEWARADVFDDADAVPLSREQLLELGASEPERSALALIPAARLLRLDASVLPLWKRVDAGEGKAAASPLAPAARPVRFASGARASRSSTARCSPTKSAAWKRWRREAPLSQSSASSWPGRSPRTRRSRSSPSASPRSSISGRKTRS